ncbi:unnamed protein product [Rhizophagus irregularis]|nr:unnamed protein product [Rhizophagus irregularis]
MCLLVIFDITSYIMENRALSLLLLTKLFLSSFISFLNGCQPFKSLCRVDDIFKAFITSCDLLSLIYIIYLHCKLSVLPRRRALGTNLHVLDVLGENDNPKNPVPPAVDKIVGGNENIGTDEITIPDIDEIEIGNRCRITIINSKSISIKSAPKKDAMNNKISKKNKKYSNESNNEKPKLKESLDEMDNDNDDSDIDDHIDDNDEYVSLEGDINIEYE